MTRAALGMGVDIRGMSPVRRFTKSLGHATRGIASAFMSEQNFRIEVLVAIGVLLAALWLGMSNVRLIVLVLLVTIVLVLELLNTFFEKLVDLVSPRLHAYVGMLKDLLAGAVLVAAVGAALAGILIFWPYVVARG